MPRCDFAQRRDFVRAGLQRVRKTQPDGGATGLGASLWRMVQLRRPPASGTAEIGAAV